MPRLVRSSQARLGACCLALAVAGPSTGTVPVGPDHAAATRTSTGSLAKPIVTAARTQEFRAAGSVHGPLHDPGPRLEAPPALQVTTSTNTPDVVNSPVASNDIPVTALWAYRMAADVMDEAAPTCGLSWTLLAAIGQVESDHGRFAGAVLGEDGVSRPLIRGIRLDGHGSVARITDTDGGRLDDDETWDRAVGPMQFLPSTWAVIGVDGDADGVRSPHDLDDAALGAAVHLCGTRENLREPDGMRRALLAYNHSASYATAVTNLDRHYRAGAFDVDSGDEAVAAAPAAFVAVQVRRPTEIEDRADADQGRRRKPRANDSNDQDERSDRNTGKKGDRDTSKEPDRDEGRVPDPPIDRPTEKEPVPPATTEPPVEVVVSGLLEACGPGFCVAGLLLDVGNDGDLAAPALADHDLDAVVESRREELTGLLGRSVEITAVESPGAFAVLAVDNHPYRQVPPSSSHRDEAAPAQAAGDSTMAGVPAASGPPVEGAREVATTHGEGTAASGEVAHEKSERDARSHRAANVQVSTPAAEADEKWRLMSR